MMSALQEQAVQLINNLSDDNVKFLIEFMQRFMWAEEKPPVNDIRAQAFERLNSARAEVWQYLPKNFNPDLELEAARRERHDNSY